MKDSFDDNNNNGGFDSFNHDSHNIGFADSTDIRNYNTFTSSPFYMHERHEHSPVHHALSHDNHEFSKNDFLSDTKTEFISADKSTMTHGNGFARYGNYQAHRPFKVADKIGFQLFGIFMLAFTIISLMVSSVDVTLDRVGDLFPLALFGLLVPYLLICNIISGYIQSKKMEAKQNEKN